MALTRSWTNTLLSGLTLLFLACGHTAQARFLSPDRMGVAWHAQRYRANLGVPGQPPLEINPYVAVANNPLRWIDPTGLFTTPLHVFMSYDAFAGSNFTNEFINEVVNANIMMDFYDYSQTVPYAHWHAMSESGESQADAYKRWYAFVKSQLKSCTARGLGHAMHAVQDSTAGGHKFSTYTGHVSYSHFLMDTEVDNATYKEAIIKSKDLIQQFRQQCECQK